MPATQNSTTTASGKVPYGDTKAATAAIKAALLDPETDPTTLALLVRDAGEAKCNVTPGGRWNPTQGFKHFYPMALGEQPFKGGVFPCYDWLAGKLRHGFTEKGTAYPANPHFAKGESAEAIYAQLCDEGHMEITQWRAMKRPKEQQATTSRTQKAPVQGLGF